MLRDEDVRNWNTLHSRIGPIEANRSEKEISRWLEVFRYRSVRKYCQGHVAEFGCGSGYGCWMVSLNPDVTMVTGFDADNDMIHFAEQNKVACVPGVRLGAPLEFFVADLNEEKAAAAMADAMEESKRPGPDTVMAIETIEHLKDPEGFVRSVILDIAPRRLILTFPSFKTTHYNPHHLHDLDHDEVFRWVRGYSNEAGLHRDCLLNTNFFDDHWVCVWELRK